MMTEREEKELQHIKEQTSKRIETLKDILADDDDKSARCALINRVAVIEDWTRRLLMTRQSRLLLNNAYMYVICGNYDSAVFCLRKLSEEVDAASALSGRDSVNLFDEDAPAEEIERYIHDFAWERMGRTPSRDFDKETQEKYHILGWRDGYFVNTHGEDDDMLGMSDYELLELSEL